jgi:predicted O-methyltransferase YrrM
MNISEHYLRKVRHAETFALIQQKIESLVKTDFIAYPQEAECIEALVQLTESKQVLELGTHTGFTTLHLIRAIYGNGMVTSIDILPQHDSEWFNRNVSKHFRFVHGETPGILKELTGMVFDFVFIDTVHSPEHTELEVNALMPLTRKGSMFVFHDVPRIQRPSDKDDCPIRKYIKRLMTSDGWIGMILPSPYRLDCARTFGANYDRDLNPHLAVLLR